MPEFKANECIDFSKDSKWPDDLDSLTDEEFDLLIEHAEFCPSHNKFLLKIEAEFKKELEELFVGDAKASAVISEENEFSANTRVPNRYWSGYKPALNRPAIIVLLFSLITAGALITSRDKNGAHKALTDGQKITLNAEENLYPDKADSTNGSVNKKFEAHVDPGNSKSDKPIDLTSARGSKDVSAINVTTNKIKPIEADLNARSASIGNKPVSQQAAESPTTIREAANPLTARLSPGHSGVSGAITDGNGEVIPGAYVRLVNPGTGFSRTVTTNDQGIYSFPGIPPATYRVEVEAANFKKTIKSDVQALVDNPVETNILLEPGDVSKVVDLTANTIESIVNTQDASLGNNFAPKQITQLPTDLKKVAELLSLRPGVTRQGDVAGRRSDRPNITLDGVDISDQLSPAFYIIDFEGITTKDLQNIRCVAVNTDNQVFIEIKPEKNLCLWKEMPNGRYDLSIILSKKNALITQELKGILVTFNSLLVKIEYSPNSR